MSETPPGRESAHEAGYKSLNESQAVEFEVKKGPKGLQAENAGGL
jgi:cold shock CspA family protein